MAEIELVLDCKNHHGEGIIWNALDQRLWWTDIEGRRICSFDPLSSGASYYDMSERISCIAPRARGGFVVAADSGFAFWSPLSDSWEAIAGFEPDLSQTRPNDGRVDRQGRLVVGGMDECDGNPVTGVYRLESDLSVTRLFGDVRCANSICFSPDGQTMYFADSPLQLIEAFDYLQDRSLPDRRRTLSALALGQGLPDGSCVDSEGFIWNAVWEGQRIERRSPGGALDRTILMPVSKPTCCTFGGEALDTLYITTSRLFSTPEELAKEPMSGGLFAIKPGVHGLIDASFAG